MRRRKALFGPCGLLGGGLLGSLAPPYFYWREACPYTIVEIKCWMQVDERRGYELVPMIKLNNSDWFYVVANDNPLRLDNRYSYTIEAPKEYQAGEFVSWQSEETGMIIPDPILRLDRGLESDTRWQNYRVIKK
jgi:hypothetical protein